MTNATDTLCVGGVKHETLLCFNKSAGFPLTHEFQGVGTEPNVVYTRRAWWNNDNQNWYWIATNADDEPSDAEIAITIAANLFPPAWDLRDRPAPEPEV